MRILVDFQWVPTRSKKKEYGGSHCTHDSTVVRLVHTAEGSLGRRAARPSYDHIGVVVARRTLNVLEIILLVLGWARQINRLPNVARRHSNWRSALFHSRFFVARHDRS